jgi:Domain of unknown function (DUF4375)
MDIRISSALVVALALVAACGQKAAQQEPVVDKSSETRKLDPPNLASIADDELQYAILDYVHARTDGRYDHEAEILAAMPAGVRALYVTSGVEEEVNNGGFNQYYWNSTGKFADQAVAAFEYFAAHQHAELMREANRIHAAEQAQIEKFKEQGTLQAFSDSYKVSKLGPLDERFYKLDENLSALIVAKIRSDPAAFALQ